MENRWSRDVKVVKRDVTSRDKKVVLVLPNRNQSLDKKKSSRGAVT